ncbi:peptide ligase PGM1-related protein [Streptomyces sp. NPDC048489]|uniref:preATP grasp domain-containing protein n=1 Tax=Streptomyces sp. NPDC048489 TaxID=3154504 RepID=UPI003418FC41
MWGGTLIIFANLFSDLAVDLREERQLAQWSQQAPREIWLLQAGDVLVSPVPVGNEFVQYVTQMTGVMPDSFTIIEVPLASAVPLAEAVHRAGLTEHLKAVAGQADTALLPTALDASAVGFARDMGFTVLPYVTVDDASVAVEVAMSLNTKSGFRQVANELGIRVPENRVCQRHEVEDAVRSALQTHERVVVKPDRSAGGHGMRFVSRGDAKTGAVLEPGAVGGLRGSWVIEECLDLAASVSIQLENHASGTRVMFSGMMQAPQGSFTGYLSPLPVHASHAAQKMEQWGLQLGCYLAQHGYLGPFGLDALVSAEGAVYAGESNVRRTATTIPHAMVARLTAHSALARPTWSLKTGRTRKAHCFKQALARIQAHRLGFEPASGEGVVLYGEPTSGGHVWRYVVMGADAAGVQDQEAELAGVLGLVVD